MISGTGWVAQFEHDGGNGPKYIGTQQIVLWKEDGDGRVVGLVIDRGRLRSAETFSNFKSYEEDEHGYAQYVSAPAGWWLVSKVVDGTGGGWWERVMFWRVSGGGYRIEAITTNEDSAPQEADGTNRFVFDTERSVDGEGTFPGTDEE